MTAFDAGRNHDDPGIEPDAMEAERARIKTAAAAYVDELLAHTSDPAFSAKLLIGDRDFMLSCMAGFACQEVTRAVEELSK